MDDFEWIRNLPDERREALKPVYDELYEVHKQDRTGGMRKFHSAKKEKLHYLQRLQSEAQNQSNNWHDRTVKLEEIGASKEAIDTAWSQCEFYSKAARNQDADIEKLWDQVTLITIIIDDHEKTSVFPTWYRLTNDPEYSSEPFDRFVDATIAYAQTWIPDWIKKPKSELFTEFDRRVNEAKDQGLRKSQDVIFSEMMQEMQDQGFEPPYTTFESFRQMKRRKHGS